MKLKLLISIKYDPKANCTTEDLTKAINNALIDALWDTVRDENNNSLHYDLNITEL